MTEFPVPDTGVIENSDLSSSYHFCPMRGVVLAVKSFFICRGLLVDLFFLFVSSCSRYFSDVGCKAPMRGIRAQPVIKCSPLCPGFTRTVLCSGQSESAKISYARI